MVEKKNVYSYIEKVVAECEEEKFNFIYSVCSQFEAHTQLPFTTPHQNWMQKYQMGRRNNIYAKCKCTKSESRPHFKDSNQCILCIIWVSCCRENVCCWEKGNKNEYQITCERN